MIELAKHIETLLLSNDCVAVPGFGGFVAHYVPARIDENDGMFLPPMRTTGFNSQLKMNDSLLVQSYVEAYDISYPEALRKIEQEVDEIREIVSREGYYILNGIGTLETNDEGSYSFVPYGAGILTPYLYGLNSYEFSLLKSTQNVNTKPITAREPVVEAASSEKVEEENETESPSLIDFMEEEDDDHAIHVKMSWIRNTVAVAAAIVLFFLLTTPVANSDMQSQSMSMLKNSVIDRLLPKDSNMAPATPVIAPENVVTQKTEAEKGIKHDSSTEQSKPKDKVVDKATANPYCIVLASQVKRSNAEIFVKKLRNRGFKDTDINVHNGVVRVVYGHFKSESEAYSELHELRFEEDFEEGWVYKRSIEG